MAASTDTSKTTASVDSLKMSSKNPSICSSSKNASTESVLSKKNSSSEATGESRVVKGSKKDLALEKKETTVLIKEDVVVKSPPIKKITIAPPNLNPDVCFEELVTSAPSERNWRGILIALLVIAAVLGLIVFSIALLSPVGEGTRVRGRRAPLDLILADRLKYKPFNGTWISDTELVFRDKYGGLAVMNADNFTTKLLMTNSTFRQLNAVDFKVSSNMKFVLLISDERKGYKYSRTARYHVYEIASRNKFPLSPIEDDREAPLLQYAAWSPDGGAIVFVHDNDIYYKPRVLKPLVCRITSTGEPGVIFNGVPDFLYETEITLSGHALWFSPDSQFLMYATHNCSNVGEHRWAWYGSAARDPPQYPQLKGVRYPKANTENPEVTIFTVNLKTPKFLFPHAVTPSSNVEPDSYVTYATWVSDRQVVLMFLNRMQNLSIINICKAAAFNCNAVYTERAQPGIWSTLGGHIGTGTPLLWGRTLQTPSFLVLASVRDGSSGAYTHVCYVDAQVGRLMPVTMGRFEVTRLVAWDEDNGYVYFMATPEGKPGQRHLYRIKLQRESQKPEDNQNGEDGQQNTRNYYQNEENNQNAAPAGNIWSDMSTMQCLTCPSEFIQGQDQSTTEINPQEPSSTVETAKTTESDLEDFSATSFSDVSLEPHTNLTVSTEATIAVTKVAKQVSLNGLNGTAKSYAHLNVERHRNGVFYLNESVPNNCLYNNVIFSTNSRYYVQECLGPEAPSVYLAEALTNCRVAVLHAGAQLRERVAGLAAPQTKSFSVEVQDGHVARVRLLLPPTLREHDEVPFPLVLHIDSSPGSQLVSEKFQIDWGWYLAGTKNFIVAQIDGRGSGFQGDNLRKEVYHRLGTVEVEDQIAVITYLRDTLKFIDGSRVCVWGWGYGGHAAVSMTAQDSLNLTRCTAAVAPMVTWAYHNTFFTERYLGSGSPAGNYRGYEAADLTRRAGNLASKSLLLATALADSTAPAQHSMALARALVRQGVMFRHQVYPDEDHEFSGSLYHLYKNFEAFFDECFGPIDINDWELAGGFFTFKQ